MDLINWLITLPGGLFLTILGLLKLYGVKNKLVSGRNKTLKENLCGT